MEMDPHTLQLIIRRIEQQMRCPQCGKRVPVDFASVRVATDTFLLLQLKCDTCDAYIVLHASLQGADTLGDAQYGTELRNASSTLQLEEQELKCLRDALAEHGGSFEKLFKAAKESGQSSGTAIV